MQIFYLRENNAGITIFDLHFISIRRNRRNNAGILFEGGLMQAFCLLRNEALEGGMKLIGRRRSPFYVFFYFFSFFRDFF